MKSNAPKFTKERREGLARLFDTLGASAIIGAALGVVGRTTMSSLELFGLVVTAMLLIVASFIIRGEDKR